MLRLFASFMSIFMLFQSLGTRGRVDAYWFSAKVHHICTMSPFCVSPVYYGCVCVCVCVCVWGGGGEVSGIYVGAVLLKKLKPITYIPWFNLSFMGSQSISLNSFFFLDVPDYSNLNKIDYIYFEHIGFYLKAPLWGLVTNMWGLVTNMWGLVTNMWRA